jgi:hypothetical protein
MISAPVASELEGQMDRPLLAEPPCLSPHLEKLDIGIKLEFTQSPPRPSVSEPVYMYIAEIKPLLLHLHLG